MEAVRQSQLKGSFNSRFSTRQVLTIVVLVTTGLLLRLWMMHKFFEVNGDALIYGGIAKNLLLHGQFGLTLPSGFRYPTLIRLPGFPFYVAALFQIFGMENYAAIGYVSIALDLLGALLVADCARRLTGKTLAALATLALAALCPFTAIYSIMPLTEAPTLFAIALALWALVRFRGDAQWRWALLWTAAITFAALLRPDGALVGLSTAPALLVALRQQKIRLHRSLLMTLSCLLMALAPFAAWTWRNWHIFHKFEPLAPRYATDPDEDPYLGYQEWVKSWCLDFNSTYQIYWNIPGAPFELDKLPARAAESPAEQSELRSIAEAYEANNEQLNHNIDVRFRHLAEQKAAAHPFRVHALLPVGRMLDMWLRPRVENLPIDLDWWRYDRHRAETRFTYFYLGLNLFYIALALVSVWRRMPISGWLLVYMALRSLMLMTIEAPEARYTLEAFPMLFLLGGMAIQVMAKPRAVAAETT